MIEDRQNINPEFDPLIWDAAALITHDKNASTSMIQRKLGVGYQRAGVIMDQLQKQGIVGPTDGVHPREVLLDDDRLQGLMTQNGVTNTIENIVTTYNPPAKEPELDPLFWESAALVTDSKNASTSMIQRKLGVGYQRAGVIMDQLQKQGIVGPTDGVHPREILVDDVALQGMMAKKEDSIIEQATQPINAPIEPTIQQVTIEPQQIAEPMALEQQPFEQTQLEPEIEEFIDAPVQKEMDTPQPVIDFSQMSLDELMVQQELIQQAIAAKSAAMEMEQPSEIMQR